MMRGPDYSMNWRGWKVYADPSPAHDMAVTITEGHGDVGSAHEREEFDKLMKKKGDK